MPQQPTIMTHYLSPTNNNNNINNINTMNSVQIIGTEQMVDSNGNNGSGS